MPSWTSQGRLRRGGQAVLSAPRQCLHLSSTAAITQKTPTSTGNDGGKVFLCLLVARRSYKTMKLNNTRDRQ